MSQPLYLKYRPQKLAELVGQEIIARTLSNALTNNKVSHAYFFTGPRGCGKTSSARILAKSLNCLHGPTLDPCGKCQNCLEIAAGISPDVIEIDAASHRGVEDATQIIERCHLASQTAQYKIYILDEVHMLSKEAFNALLKTIEEPPKNVVFILATTEEHKVPPTIVSRCQRFPFRSIDAEPLKVRLKQIAEIENINLSEATYARIVKQSKGGLRDALSILDQISILGAPGERIEEKVIFDLFGMVSEDALAELLKALLEGNPKEVLGMIDRFLGQGVEPLQLMRNLIEHSIDHLEEALNHDAHVAQQPLIEVIEGLSAAEFALRNATQPILKLKSSLLALALPENRSLLGRLAKLEKELETLKLKGPVTNVKAAVIKPEAPVSGNSVVSSFEPTQNVKLSSNDVPKPSPVVPPATEEVATSSIINLLLANLKHAPTKALVKDSKIFLLNQRNDLLVFGVPREAFFDKLNDPKKLKIIKDTLAECTSKSFEIRFELSQGAPATPEAVSPFVAEDSAPQVVAPTKPQEPPKAQEEPAPVQDIPALESNEDEAQNVLKVAQHILGAKPIKS